MALIARISVQNLILGNQTFGALCQKYFVAKFQRRPYLAALNEIGMRLKYGVELLRIRNLFSLEHATARLINHTRRPDRNSARFPPDTPQSPELQLWFWRAHSWSA